MVLMGDGKYGRMTAAEFKAAALAKPPHKEEKLLGKWKMEPPERGGRERESGDGPERDRPQAGEALSGPG
jgi:hypothetical protein